MSTTQAHVESKIRSYAAATPKAKPKSAGALRMARARAEKEMLDRTARTYHSLFLEGTFPKLAENNPNGSTLAARRWMLDAWLKAARVPDETRKQLIETVISR